MEQAKAVGISLVLLVLVILSCYFFYKAIFNNQTETPQNKFNPDIIIYDLTSLSFDKQGVLSVKLSTPQMKYNSYTKDAEFTKPIIIFYQNKKANTSPWVITANIGTLTQQPKLYKLIGNVALNQGATATTRSTQITTSKLTINPTTNIAHTDQLIHFMQTDKNNSTIAVSSIGAIANQKTGEVKLLSKAAGDYHVKQN